MEEQKKNQKRRDISFLILILLPFFYLLQGKSHTQVDVRIHIVQRNKFFWNLSEEAVCTDMEFEMSGIQTYHAAKGGSGAGEGGADGHLDRKSVV